MKNLEQHVQKIFDESTLKNFDTVRQLCHEMIDFSDGKPDTKKLHHNAVDRKPENLLQFWARDYWLSGLGLKVIK
jgi:transcription elongation factor GreA-like protein